MRNTWRILLAIVITVALGASSGLVTNTSLDTWYTTLNKPSWNPPNAVFGPVWTILYILMGLAAGLVWNVGPERSDVRRALAIYVLQLGLNVLWTLLFFGLRSPIAALVDILMLLGAIIWCMQVFGALRPAAGRLLLPYLAWVLFASVLNTAIVALN